MLYPFNRMIGYIQGCLFSSFRWWMYNRGKSSKRRLWCRNNPAPSPTWNRLSQPVVGLFHHGATLYMMLWNQCACTSKLTMFVKSWRVPNLISVFSPNMEPALPAPGVQLLHHAAPTYGMREHIAMNWFHCALMMMFLLGWKISKSSRKIE